MTAPFKLLSMKFPMLSITFCQFVSYFPPSVGSIFVNALFFIGKQFVFHGKFEDIDDWFNKDLNVTYIKNWNVLLHVFIVFVEQIAKMLPTIFWPMDRPKNKDPKKINDTNDVVKEKDTGGMANKDPFPQGRKIRWKDPKKDEQSKDTR